MQGASLREGIMGFGLQGVPPTPAECNLSWDGSQRGPWADVREETAALFHVGWAVSCVSVSLGSWLPQNSLQLNK